MANYFKLVSVASVLCIGLVYCNLKDYENCELHFEREKITSGGYEKCLLFLNTIEDYFLTNQTIVANYYRGKDDAELKARKYSVLNKGHFFRLHFDENNAEGNAKLEEVLTIVYRRLNASEVNTLLFNRKESITQLVLRYYKVETGKLSKNNGKDEHPVKFLLLEYTGPRPKAPENKPVATQPKKQFRSKL